MAFDYDVIIIGSGPAGFSCAMQSTKFDKKVLIVEADGSNLGGTWLNKGTVPSKALREAANLIQKFHSQFGDEKGRKPFERFKMDDLMLYKKSILESKNRQVKNDLIKNEVDTARGVGLIVDDHTVQVTNQMGEVIKYTTENILIATGSSPKSSKNISVEHKGVLDYDSVLDLTHIPRRLVIVGTGIITFEYATIFAALGTRITILCDSDDLLPFLDKEIKDELMKILKKKNIQIYKEAKVKKLGFNDLRTCMEISFKQSGSDRLHVSETDQVLHIGGKKPNSENLWYKPVKIKTDKEGFIKVNSTYQTETSNIYAVGDVIGDPSSASVSFVQGRLASCTMFDMPKDSPSLDVPYGIYSIPEIAGIGLTELKAQEMGIDVTVGRAYYESITQANIKHENDGLLKLVFRTDNLKLVGVHIIGNHAADLIHLGQSVMVQNGSIKYFIENVLNYPTYAEAYKIAAFNGVNRVYKAGVKYKKILER
jgi:NAD(P) transhydrogenase